MHIGRNFSLSDAPGIGVSCGEHGLFVGTVPLLERRSSHRPFQWRPRRVAELNCDLSQCYGLPIEVKEKLRGLETIAFALNRGDMIHAQIATLHLEIPAPPSAKKPEDSSSNWIELAQQLRASGLLKADWDPSKHPRWPAGSPGGIGGEFAPTGAGAPSATVESDAQVTPAQITIPAPFELPGGIPFPSEILPPPVIPNVSPRDLPQNPYPDRPECEEEWVEATKFCLKLAQDGKLGRGDYRGMGRTVSECILGQVSENCGGNTTGT